MSPSPTGKGSGSSRSPATPPLPTHLVRDRRDSSESARSSTPLLLPDTPHPTSVPHRLRVLTIAALLLTIPLVLIFSPRLLRSLLPSSPHHSPHHSHPPPYWTGTATRAGPSAGAHETAHWPPKETDGKKDEKYFGTPVGYEGPTPTGAEPEAVQTAPVYSINKGAWPLVPPQSKDGGKSYLKAFHHLGNLCPAFTAEPYIHDITPVIPPGYEIGQVHLLHRHGARYPTSAGGPVGFAIKVHEHAQRGKLAFSGELAFLNDWTYKLGADILTPFGREQLFTSGVGFRVRYGHLLEGFKRLPVFRTTTQDRMLKSAHNWLAGFFGIPYEEQVHLSVGVEAAGFNNSLVPQKICPNAVNANARRGGLNAARHINISLAHAVERLQPLVHGMNLNVADVYKMQELCAYETVALGWSAFCTLFTEKEWESFGYSLDLIFDQGFGFGSPTGKAQGIGYVQELLARLTGERIESHNSSTNATLDDSPVTFPLDQPIYADFTHDTVLTSVVAALNLTQFASHLSWDRVPRFSPHNPRWKTSVIAPFAGNIVFQVLRSPSHSSLSPSSTSPSSHSFASSESHLEWKGVRVVLNDAVLRLDGLGACGASTGREVGLCELGTFVRALRETVREVDFVGDCFGDYVVGPDEVIEDGRPPRKYRS